MTNRFPYSEESKMKLRLHWIQYHKNIVGKIFYLTVTDFARFRGLSGSFPNNRAIRYASNWMAI